MNVNDGIAMTQAHINCQSCSISKLCLPMMLAETEVEHLEHIIKRRKPYSKGDTLFTSGQQLEALYVVRSGCVKTYTVTPDGIEQITGFYLPGEMLGLDAVNTETHQCFAKAIETTLVCNLPYNQLNMLAGEIPAIRKHLLKIMSREIQDDKSFFLLLNKKNTDERLAAFLTNLSSRYANRGLSPTSFNLVMTRIDIANYLGMAIETISRSLKKLKEQDIIDVQDKTITIKNMKQLGLIAGINCLH